MKIDCTRSGDILVAALSGEFDFDDVTEASDTIGKHVDRGATRVVFDLSDLGFISSGGLGYFIQTAKRARAEGGDVVLARPPASFGWIAETLGINRVLRIFATVNEAVGHLSEAQADATGADPPQAVS